MSFSFLLFIYFSLLAPCVLSKRCPEAKRKTFIHGRKAKRIMTYISAFFLSFSVVTVHGDVFACYFLCLLVSTVCVEFLLVSLWERRNEKGNDENWKNFCWLDMCFLSFILKDDWFFRQKIIFDTSQMCHLLCHARVTLGINWLKFWKSKVDWLKHTKGMNIRKGLISFLRVFFSKHMKLFSRS